MTRRSGAGQGIRRRARSAGKQSCRGSAKGGRAGTGREAGGRGSDPTESSLLESYWAAARRPLPTLYFLLPLIVAYELGLVFRLTSDEGVLTNVAHESLLRLFDVFGLPVAGGLYMGGALIVIVLIVWHLLTADPWRVRPGVVLLMAVESVVLVGPLLVFGQIVAGGMAAGLSGGMAGGVAVTDLSQLDPISRVAISVGAGLYEELIFRMLLIAVLHTLLVDVVRASNGVGSTVAVVVSAACFAVYHPLADASGELAWNKLIFFFGAGVYFGVIFLARGFGIVVATHALYDVVISLYFLDGG